MNVQSGQTTCAVCGNKIENNSFARIINGNRSILLCSPKCALAYFNGSDKSHSPVNGSRPNGSLNSNPSWYDLDASLSGQNSSELEVPK